MQKTMNVELDEDIAATLPPVPADEALTRWQRRLLPLMEGMVVGLTVFFFLASCAQLIYLHQRIGQAPRVDASELLPNPPTGAEPAREAMELARLRAIIALETNTLERRHHQANVLLMSQLWIRYLGFVTGMILALVGATFILGKLQEQFSELRADVGGAEGILKSSSPGLMLVVFGAILMLATIVVRHEISVTDAPVYTREWSLTPNVNTESMPPQLPPRKSTSQ
jgi:hypothetical protein